MELTIRKRKPTVVGNSIGFVWPAAYTEERMDGGISAQKYYDITVTEVEANEEQPNHTD